MQISHSSQLLHQITAALSAARQQHEEPVSRACAALKAVVAAHGQLQVTSFSESQQDLLGVYGLARCACTDYLVMRYYAVVFESLNSPNKK